MSLTLAVTERTSAEIASLRVSDQFMRAFVHHTAAFTEALPPLGSVAMRNKLLTTAMLLCARRA